MTSIFNETDFQNFDKRFRTNFFNSLVGYRSLHLVGTRNSAGKTNLAPFSSIIHMGSNPAYFGMLFRPSDEVPRHTLSNILETGQYTFNQVHKSFLENAHHTSAKYSEEISEFDACGFEPEYIDDFQAPFVKSSNIKIGLSFVEKHEMHFNKTTFVVGKVVKVIVNNELVSEDGFLNILNAGSISGVGIDGYAFVEQITRLNYARPTIAPSILKL